MKKILILMGTRPEAVKMAPIIKALELFPDQFQPYVCSTGQHGLMLEQTLNSFGIRPDTNLKVMTGNQNLAGLSSRLFTRLDSIFASVAPDLALVQGDTTSVQIASLCAFYRHIDVGHVEAGLRTGDLLAPFPEELNRRIATLASRWHFAPTPGAKMNLIKEGVPEANILVTGNTGIDALLLMREITRKNPPLLPEPLESVVGIRKMILVTGHRRENFGEGVENMCLALSQIARARPDIALVYPVHLNPNIHEPVMRMLSGHANIFLIDPQPYAQFTRLLEQAALVLTDSGGIQEEAATLGKKMLVMRETTERPEGVEAGLGKLVGTDPEKIVAETLQALDEPCNGGIRDIYGDGHAAMRIAEFLSRQYQ